MKDTLYVVNRKEVGGVERPFLLGTVTKEDNVYHYQPNKDAPSSFLMFRSEIKSKDLPPMAARRLYSPKRPDIKDILESLGLKEYDAWEILKKTKGKLLTDKIMYLSEAEYKSLMHEYKEYQKGEFEAAASLGEMIFFSRRS